MISIDNVTFAYHRDFDILQNVSATFNPGVNLLLGPNGAGKTTLLKIIAGLLRPQKGEVVYGKKALNYHSPHAVRDIFFLSEDTLFPLKTLRDMVKRHAPFYPNFSISALNAALEEFGIGIDDRLADMSLGARHKANVAYALALGTPIQVITGFIGGICGLTIYSVKLYKYLRNSGF